MRRRCHQSGAAGVIRYLLDRLLALIPVLILVLVIIFSLPRLIPGDPAVTLLGPGATQEQITALPAPILCWVAELKADSMGSDRPWTG